MINEEEFMIDKERVAYLLELLEQSHSCISTAISVELEYADYDRVETLKTLRHKIEKELSRNDHV